jgi:hypothetical protein
LRPFFCCEVGMFRSRRTLSIVCALLLMIGGGGVLLLGLAPGYRAPPPALIAAACAFWLGAIWLHELLVR